MNLKEFDVKFEAAFARAKKLLPKPGAALLLWGKSHVVGESQFCEARLARFIKLIEQVESL